MYEIITSINIADEVTTESVVLDLTTQEEALDFLNDFISMESSVLYDLLKKVGDRTFVAIDPAHRRSLRRSASGTSSKDGRAPIQGSVSITARRVA